ncbi:MAG: 50S ribosomal protein L23 [Patescibacteria group bacterium]
MSIFTDKKEKEVKKPAEEKVAVVPEGGKKVLTPASTLRGRLMLRRPHVSEKTTRIGAFHQYAFMVDPRANKRLVKNEVERLYKVDVIRVNMVRLSAKPKKWMRTVGKQSIRKKAIVTLKKGQKIEII